MAKKNKTFEDNIRRLEEISSLLESEEIGLEEAITLYEEGINLSKGCIETLNSAELKVTELKKKLHNVPPGQEEIFED